jgi:chloramphenicol-sensitive protein RarD
VTQRPDTALPQYADATASARRGVMAVSAAFMIWGLFPLYLKPLTQVPALEILSHRIAWCLLFVFGWLAWKSRLGEVAVALSAALIAINWGVYVWAVSNGRVLEASLGYFIGPLVNVLLGVVALKERLHPRQWVAVGFAATGVAWLTVAAGGLPWVSLVLAVSFGIYGLVRKVVNVAAVPGLAIETVLLAPLALAWLGWLHHAGVGTFGNAPIHVSVMLVGSGLITALPLALFSTGARLIPYSVVGIITYIGPSLQLLSGVFVYGEPFAGARAVGFCIIWAGIAIFVADNVLRSRRPLAASLPPT